LDYCNSLNGKGLLSQQ